MSELSQPPSTAAEPERQLEHLWRAGQRPLVKDFLADAGDLSPEQVLAVLVVDQCERWNRGERVAAESYLQAFPALTGNLEMAIELIYGEFLLREELGETPPPEEYLQRFPQFAERLRQQISLRCALKDPSSHPSAEAPAPTLPAVVVPSEAGSMPQVPGYEIQNLLGRGAMGIVYRAWHKELQRPVALKMIRPGAEADYLERFLSEGRAAARLQHPHIVQVFAVGQHEGKPFLA